LRKHFTIPIGVGFGIADAEDAKRIGAVADAVIVGSRIVREIEQQRGRENEAVAELVRGLKQALDGAD
ncbi:tryptophan synthase subunit alpha, partial [Conchiformibius kuhniae]